MSEMVHPCGGSPIGRTRARPEVFEDQQDWQWWRDITFRLSAYVIKGLERHFAAHARLSRWYGERLYRQVLDRELDMIEIEPGARVLHIGMGALPYTACYLARRGFLVDAVDHDGRVLAQARSQLRVCGVAHRVTVMEQDGLKVDASSYAAVWVSLHVHSKQLVLERLLRTVRAGCWIVYREPRSWLKLFYHFAGPSPAWRASRSGVCAHRLSKESIALRSAIAMSSK